MNTRIDTVSFRRPSAMIPILMSAVALVIVLIALSTDAPARATDEGIAAHLFQLLMVGQAPIVAFFAVRWFPRDPAHALWVMGAQLLAAALALFPVALFGL
jgi:hypothetical protein